MQGLAMISTADVIDPEPPLSVEMVPEPPRSTDIDPALTTDAKRRETITGRR
jgi:hypothetical protein